MCIYYIYISSIFNHGKNQPAPMAPSFSRSPAMALIPWSSHSNRPTSTA